MVIWSSKPCLPDKASSKVDRKAVVDLGSNTFHIIIAESGVQNRFEIIYRRREFVFLAQGGVDYISEEAVSRALESLMEFKSIAQEYAVNQIRVVGTACFREAKNAQELVTKIKDSIGWSVEILTGDEEASYIARGLNLAALPQGCNLLMDIGGASTEFILQSGDMIEFLVSHKIGISTLRHDWQRFDPPSESQKRDCFTYIDNVVGNSISIFSKARPTVLVGASGPFEILQSIIDGPSKIGEVGSFLRSSVMEAIAGIIKGSFQDRQGMDGMPDDRADLAMESMMLILFILDNLPSIDTVMCVPFALKEGLMAEMFRQV